MLDVRFEPDNAEGFMVHVTMVVNNPDIFSAIVTLDLLYIKAQAGQLLPDYTVIESSISLTPDTEG